MIIKIDLLPRAFMEKRVVKKVAIAVGVLFIILMMGMVSWLTGLNKHLGEITMQAQQMQTNALEVTQLEADTAAITGTKIPALKLKTQFVEDVDADNEQWAKILGTVARYTYRKVTYTAISPEPDKIVIDAHTDTVSSVGRYLLGMLRCPAFTYVHISQVPGYPPKSGSDGSSGYYGLVQMASASTLSFQVTCTLKNPLRTPAYGGASAAAGAAAGAAPGASMMPTPGGVAPMPGPAASSMGEAGGPPEGAPPMPERP